VDQATVLALANLGAILAAGGYAIYKGGRRFGQLEQEIKTLRENDIHHLEESVTELKKDVKDLRDILLQHYGYPPRTGC
jgi:hypothetical protein